MCGHLQPDGSPHDRVHYAGGGSWCGGNGEGGLCRACLVTGKRGGGPCSICSGTGVVLGVEVQSGIEDRLPTAVVRARRVLAALDQEVKPDDPLAAAVAFTADHVRWIPADVTWAFLALKKFGLNAHEAAWFLIRFASWMPANDGLRTVLTEFCSAEGRPSWAWWTNGQRVVVMMLEALYAAMPGDAAVCGPEEVE